MNTSEIALNQDNKVFQVTVESKIDQIARYLIELAQRRKGL